jgi:hypothetical protein
MEAKKTIVDLKFISYDGKYPNLCGGKLTIIVVYSDGTEYPVVFGSDYHRCLTSGGEYGNEDGKWTFEFDDYNNEKDKFPEFTPMVIAYLEKIINDNIPQGCCGGCS